MPRILVIKPSSLGDIVHGLQVVASLKEQVAGVHVTWVVREIFAPLVRACTAVDEVIVFHAGTRLQDGVLKTSGGRVLCVTALADTVKVAQARAYDAVHQIHYDGMQFRGDIGFRALKA